jgi:hypothetical protein
MAPMTDRKSPIEQALDLFFYAPLGFLLNAQEVVPELIEKGHQQVVVARMFGKFAVHDQAPKQLNALQQQVQKVTEQFTSRSPSSAAAAPPSENGAVAAATQTSAPVEDAPVPTAAHGPAAAGLAIPDYDSLSASQVVPRLEGLSSAELAAVRAYETEHRGRKTILSKIDQLDG